MQAPSLYVFQAGHQGKQLRLGPERIKGKFGEGGVEEQRDCGFGRASAVGLRL